MQPLPPSPALMRIRASSMNIDCLNFQVYRMRGGLGGFRTELAEVGARRQENYSSFTGFPSAVA